jgi:Na+-translocating ferredoxin:NAD+ oxidoreductase RnfG subunit
MQVLASGSDNPSSNKMMKQSLLLVFFVCGAFSNTQRIDYNPKALQKEIEKLWESEKTEMNEIDIPDSLYNEDLLSQGKIYGIQANNLGLGIVYIGRIFSCRGGGGCGSDDLYDESGSVDEDLEFFDVFMLFDRELTITSVRVYNYQATHGHEVGSKGWLKQFIGYRGEEKLMYGKNIDAVAGATISGTALTWKVQEASSYMKRLKSVLDKYVGPS